MLQFRVRVPYIQLIIAKPVSKAVRHVRLDHDTFLKSVHHIPRQILTNQRKRPGDWAASRLSLIDDTSAYSLSGGAFGIKWRHWKIS